MDASPSIWADGFDPQPVLTGERLLLRPTVAVDWDALYAVASDPEIWAIHPANDRWQEPVFRAYFEAGLASGGNLTVIDRASGSAVGSSRYYNDWTQDDEVAVGYTFLGRSHWGGGYNREMKRLMVGHALHHYRVVIFHVGGTNLRSRRAMEKIGGRMRPDMIDITHQDRPTIGHVVFEIDAPIGE